MEKENFNEQERACEKVLLVGVDDGTQGEDFERSMEELKSLAKACFMEPVGVITQRMESVNKGLYIGTGKVQEVKEASQLLNADVIIFDDALTPSQLRNLQNELEKPILDRTTLILDIFETRARTREAKLQVESAKLNIFCQDWLGCMKRLPDREEPVVA